ncbi:MAG: hypothetical protein EXS03_06370 [Phycisphaerales bacterium]|nr:hypothetical protein [Phycisphaerales bacterium]
MGFAQAPPPAPVTAPSSPPPKAPLAILYDTIPDPAVAIAAEPLEARRYLIVYQGCDPQSTRTGLINLDAVIKDIERQLKDDRPKWGMLDFEDPFTADLQSGPDTEEHSRAVRTMVEAMRAVKARFPGIQWTYYNTPFVPYWFDGKNWGTADSAMKVRRLDRLYKTFAPLVAELDWVSPSLYPVYDPAQFKPEQADPTREEGRAWRTNAVGIAKILAGTKPVIPTISPYWQPGGIATPGTIVPRNQIVEDFVAPIASAGARGIALWTGAEGLIGKAVKGPQPGVAEEADFSSRVWRDAFTRDYFDGRPPENWGDPAVRSILARRVSETITDCMAWVRATESSSPAP